MDQPGADRISSLPSNVIDCIMEHMSLEDTVRTSTLSRKWRYMWAEVPCLRFDKEFSQGIKLKRPLTFQDDFINIVEDILRSHYPPIKEFLLDISELDPSEFYGVDRCLMFASSMDVRILELKSSDDKLYNIPADFFSFVDLNNLVISNCIFQLPNAFAGFRNLSKLNLEKVTLDSSISVHTPLLDYLSVTKCTGIHHLNIFAPKLECLVLLCNDYVDFSHYIVCKDLIWVCIAANNVVKHKKQGEWIDLAKLLGSWPDLLELAIDASTMKSFAVETNQEKLPVFVLTNLKRLSLFCIDYDLVVMSHIIRILQGTVILRQLAVSLKPSANTEMKLENCLKEAIYDNGRLDQLHRVTIEGFKGSEVDVLFANLLLTISPSLEKMFIVEDETIDLLEKVKLLKELLQLQRVNRNAQVIYQSDIIHPNFI